MNPFLKKYVVFALIAAATLTATAAMAATGVANTKHNLAIGGPSNVFSAAPASGLTQVCIFCHTPHNAGQNKLLWNKANNSNINFRLYTSSATLTNTVKKFSSLPAGSPSLLCLGCHDGKTAMNILHNTTNGVDPVAAGAIGYPAGSRLIPKQNGQAVPVVMPDPVTDMFTGQTAPAMNIGGPNGSAGDNLTDDHPIGFSYSNAYTDKGVGKGLHDWNGMDSKVRFFGASKRVECSTCHDPHIDPVAYPNQKPFLVKSNVGSALCLTCHDK